MTRLFMPTLVLLGLAALSAPAPIVSAGFVECTVTLPPPFSCTVQCVFGTFASVTVSNSVPGTSATGRIDCPPGNGQPGLELDCTQVGAGTRTCTSGGTIPNNGIGQCTIPGWTPGARVTCRVFD